MQVKHVMTRDVAAVRADEPMSEAARLMWERDCGSVPVVDGAGRVVGIVTDRDLCMAAHLRDQRLAAMPVRDSMTREVHCCSEDDACDRVHTTMRRHRVRRTPVVDADGRLVGIVSLNDLALATEKRSQKERLEVAQTLAEVCRHRLPALV